MTQNKRWSGQDFAMSPLRPTSIAKDKDIVLPSPQNCASICSPHSHTGCSLKQQTAHAACLSQVIATVGRDNELAEIRALMEQHMGFWALHGVSALLKPGLILSGVVLFIAAPLAVIVPPLTLAAPLVAMCILGVCVLLGFAMQEMMRRRAISAHKDLNPQNFESMMTRLDQLEKELEPLFVNRALNNDEHRQYNSVLRLRARAEGGLWQAVRVAMAEIWAIRPPPPGKLAQTQGTLRSMLSERD